jgi:hypothetical protein
VDSISTDMYLAAGIKQTLGMKAIRYVT